MRLFSVVCLESFPTLESGCIYEVMDEARCDYKTIFYNIGGDWYNSTCFKELRKVRDEKLKKLGI
jgi:hypothetical protein